MNIIIALLVAILIVLVWIGSYLLGQWGKSGNSLDNLEITLIGDTRCAECNVDQLEQNIKNDQILGGSLSRKKKTLVIQE